MNYDDKVIGSYDLIDDALFLNQEIVDNEDKEINLYFAIIRELRHKYQIQNDLFNDDEYVYRKDSSSTDEYNLQNEEVEANAYAMIKMIDIFRVKPLFQNYSEKVKEKIKNRAIEILHEELENIDNCIL